MIWEEKLVSIFVGSVVAWVRALDSELARIGGWGGLIM